MPEKSTLGRSRADLCILDQHTDTSNPLSTAESLVHSLRPDRAQLRPTLHGHLEGIWYEYKQRAYIQYLIPSNGWITFECLQQFFILLLNRSDLTIKIGDKLSCFKHDNPMRKDFVLGLNRSSSSLEDLSSMSWGDPDWLGVETEEDFTKMLMPGVEELVQPLDVTVASLSWDTDVDLQAVIAEVALTAGIEGKFGGSA